MATRDRVQAVMTADGLTLRVVLIEACDQCQDHCYTCRGWAGGTIGSQEWETCIVFREHMSLLQALAHLRNEFGKIVNTMEARERALIIAETNQRLW